jgi:hypothetical protein
MAQRLCSQRWGLRCEVALVFAYEIEGHDSSGAPQVTNERRALAEVVDDGRLYLLADVL